MAAELGPIAAFAEHRGLRLGEVLTFENWGGAFGVGSANFGAILVARWNFVGAVVFAISVVLIVSIFTLGYCRGLGNCATTIPNKITLVLVNLNANANDITNANANANANANRIANVKHQCPLIA
ncbi:hypothetical protein AAMO2058_000153300 [Amorphochlora amoebiformis]